MREFLKMNTGNKLRLATLAGLVVLTSGCTNLSELRDPQTTDMVLDGETMPEVNRISIPMPEPKPVAAPVRAEASSLWGRETKSFFQDKRAKAVGDLLTVKIDIDDEAQLRNATGRSRDGSLNAGNPVALGEQLITPDGDLVDLRSDSSTSSEGQVKRNEKISLRVASTIIKRLPNGNFVIAGRQEVKVNYELRELRIAGIVRPVDINLDNSISYDKIAEARISYGGRGQISSLQRARYGEDILEVILPY
ncbi:flagellar basal body L-ring protein FlgH [Roseovarius indicus]|uniref:Flagellar L-ring protein n=2 Tax=Roseovarius indicus TaxID=540747 RepID=A0A5P3AAI9_9RHOB|nr:flagellar basal body L-ring protein FlgH [Roseovarius indicus]QEW25590.1 Basal body L-ring protein [Roseovarius indicus]SFE02395.1 flagellar L-ring protein precursor FlgH [Roseovarius indicus]